MRIVQIPVFNDNYAHLIIDPATRRAAAVDPADADPVAKVIADERLELEAILCTHKHFDHAGGNLDLLKDHPRARVVGGEIDADGIPGCTDRVGHDDEVRVGSLTGRVLFVPCHTRGHVAYLFGDALFCGDTLFVGACGRFFEGTAEQMHRALNHVFAALDPATRVYCGHEYTVSSLTFAATIERDNPALQQKLTWAKDRRQRGLSTVPSTLAEELSYNPFMRVDQPPVAAAVGATDPIEVMRLVRERKDRF